MVLRKILTALAIALSYGSIAFAQSPGAALDAQNAAQDAAIGAAAAKNTVQDDALADLIARVTAIDSDLSDMTVQTGNLKASFDGLVLRVDALDARIKALEAGGGSQPPTPVPTPPPVVSISGGGAAAEGALFTFSIDRAGDLSKPSTVSYAVTGSADAADFAPASHLSDVIAFAAGESAKTVILQSNDDSVVEADEPFDVSLSAPIDAVLGVPEIVSAAILNNDATIPPPTGPPPSSGAVWPDGADGKPIVTLVLGHHREWQGENPYKNTLLLADFAPAAKIIAGEADPGTGWICLNPNETITLGFVRPNQGDGVNFDPGKWVARAEIIPGSSASINAPGFLDDGSTATLIRKSRILDDSTHGNDQVSIAGGAAGGCIRPDFVGPEKYENDPRDDFRPEFVRDASRYHFVRFLDWTTTSGSRITNAAEWIDDADAIVYSGTNCFKATCYINKSWPPAGPMLRSGYKFAQMFKLARDADIAVWVNTPAALGFGAVKADIITCKAATLIPAIGANWATIEPAIHQEAFAYGIKLARSAKSGGYPDRKALNVEIGNEFWNSGNSAFACTNDVAEGVGFATTGVNSVGEGVGVIAAIQVAEIKRAFVQEKPGQALSFSVGMQTAAFSTAIKTFHNGFVTAFKRYETSSGISPSNLLDVFAATTGYYSGHSQWNANRSPGALNNPFGASTEAEFNAGYIAADGDGSLFDKARAWYLGSASNNMNVAKLVQIHNNWRNWAVNAGMRGVIQYEGSGANGVGSGANQLGGVYPGTLAAEKRWARSQQAFDVQDAIISGISAIDPMNPAVTTGWRPKSMPVSNYQSIGIIDLGSPWKEKFPGEAGTCPQVGTSGAWCKYARIPMQ